MDTIAGKYIRQLLFLIVLFFCILIAPCKTLANESIKNFDVTLTAQKDGIMKVSEKIVYDFGYGERHGIYRYIPTISRVGNLYRVIKINFDSLKRDGNNESYSVDISDSQAQVKIGNANKTITGIHEYEINYSVENGIGSNYVDHDEIYWNVTGNEWDVPIETASITLLTDTGVTIDKSICFTGALSSKDSDCTIEQSNGAYKISTTRSLFSNEGLTIVSSFPVGTFPKSILQKEEPIDPDLKILAALFTWMLVICNLVIAPILIFWYVTKKRKKRFGKPVVNFDFPKDTQGLRLAPANAGTIDNTKLDQNDIVATIFDLAIRKYISIEQIKVKGKILGIGKRDEYKLTKLKGFDDLSSFEKTLGDSLFGGSESVMMKDTTISYTDFTNLEEENFKYLISKKIYVKNPKSQMATLLVFGIIAFSFGNIILGLVLLFLSRKLNGRTQLGDELDYKIDGLKLFLKATDRYHTWQTKNLLFLEKMIPYAIALGFIDEFMKQLKIIAPNYSPSWYRGNNLYLSYHAFSSSASSHITTSAPSSSSGFSGGSSGGGGGGGGGGSW